jgi:hypothetical protein
MHTMHLLPAVAIHPNLELKTQPKQLLGYLPLVIVLPECNEQKKEMYENLKNSNVRSDILEGQCSTVVAY